MMVYRAAALSDAGGRDENQDRLLCAPHRWALADGLGGHVAGAAAAEAAVHAPLEEANEAVARTGGRSTLVRLEADDAHARWWHIGDTRLYHFRGGAVAAQTRDHSVPQMLVDTGELDPAGIRGHEDRSRLVRSLGNSTPARFSAGEATVEPGDVFLLATDGFWEHVTEERMLSALAAAPGPEAWLQALADGITAPDDNYSAIAVFAREE